MELSVKTIKFDATDKLQQFIQKKAGKLEKFCSEIRKVEVSLKVVKPASALNKCASVKVLLPGEDLFVEKTCDTFEESIDQSMAALEKQLSRYKEKQSKK